MTGCSLAVPEHKVHLHRIETHNLQSSPLSTEGITYLAIVAWSQVTPSLYTMSTVDGVAVAQSLPPIGALVCVVLRRI